MQVLRTSNVVQKGSSQPTLECSRKRRALETSKSDCIHGQHIPRLARDSARRHHPRLERVGCVHPARLSHFSQFLVHSVPVDLFSSGFAERRRVNTRAGGENLSLIGRKHVTQCSPWRQERSARTGGTETLQCMQTPNSLLLHPSPLNGTDRPVDRNTACVCATKAVTAP